MKKDEIRVLHVAETIKGGVATVLKNLLSYQVLKYDVKCIIPQDQCNELIGYEKNTTTFNRTGRNVTSSVRFIFKLIKTIFVFKPDVVHLHSSFSGVYGRIALLVMFPLVRPKIIYCPHAFSFLMQVSDYKIKLFALIEYILQFMTDKIICVSEYERNKALGFGLSSKKLITIHNGAPAPTLTVGSERLCLNDELVRLLFIGRFDHQKGYDLLISAMNQIDKNKYHLTVIGGGVHDDCKFSNKENITYLGWLSFDEVTTYIKMADAIIVPSRWEGFAMVPLEAMSYGVSVIASDASSLPEVIEDSINGYLFENGNVNSLIDVINKCTKNDLKIMGENGEKIYKKFFTSDEMIKKTESLYDNILRNN